MCYGEDVAPLSFEGFHLACLSGDNGHGKSALLDALTWCLWGRARARSDEELVHLGRTEMEVELEFELGDNRYRVIRKRSLRPGTRRAQGVPTLEFQVRDGTEFRSITGNSIAETQRRILEALRMDYDTFINSAFLLQGRADEFTIKPPAERKRVLAEILGLGLYDVWEERARELARERDSRRRELQSALAEIEHELEKRPAYEAEHLQAEQTLAGVEVEVKRLEAEVNHLRGKKRELAVKEQGLIELQERLHHSERELAEVRQREGEHRRRLAELNETLSQRESVQAGHRRLLALREREAELGAQSSRFAALAERRAKLEAALAESRQMLLAQIRAHEASAASMRGRAEGMASWQRELAEIEAKLEATSRLEMELNAAREAWQRHRQEIEALRDANQRLRKEMVLLKEKIELLAGAGATCPLCGHSLGRADREHLQIHFRAQGRELGDEYRINAARMREQELEAEKAQRQMALKESALRERLALQRRQAVLEKSLADAADFIAQAEAYDRAAAALRQRLETEDYAPAERAALAKLAAESHALGYDAAAHQQVREELSRLARFEILQAQLELAIARQEEEQAALERESRAAARWEARLASERAALDASRHELDELPSLTRRLAQAERELDSLLARQSEARQHLGRAQQMLNHCRYLETQREEKLRALDRAAQEKSIYDDLALAFGKKGIQAMLIESAIPEIEREANALLSRMTDNALQVSFETQRDAKSVDGVIETLDIRVADELGERSYETYSGGEAFRVNFAIRIALSQLLARRAGAKLQTLIIDEGFGTQDAQGRERLVEAINSISGDFEKILVITHIQELKDAFPVRIEVVKGPEGSQIRVT